MYAFFQKYLNNPGDSADMEVKPLSAEDLKVTSSGQLSTSLKGETIFSLNLKDAEKLNVGLDAKRKNIPGYFPAMLDAAKKRSGYQEPKRVNAPVFAGRFKREGYVIEKFFVKGEGEYIIPYLLLKPDKPGTRAMIYLNPMGKAADAAIGGEVEWFVKNGFTVLVPDLIGTGEMGPGVFKGDTYIDSTSYNIWFSSMLIGRSIVGVRAGDVVRLTRLLQNNGDIKEIYGLAKKEMAPVLLHAAAFDTGISRIALINPYSSYQSIVSSCRYDPAFIHSTVPGALGMYDLPDLAASLAPRKLMMVNITDASGNAIATKDMNDLSVVCNAYKRPNDKEQLQIVTAETKAKLQDSYKEWINN
jgi:hypothetical protein